MALYYDGYTLSGYSLHCEKCCEELFAEENDTTIQCYSCGHVNPVVNDGIECKKCSAKDNLRKYGVNHPNEERAKTIAAEREAMAERIAAAQIRQQPCGGRHGTKTCKWCSMDIPGPAIYCPYCRLDYLGRSADTAW